MSGTACGGESVYDNVLEGPVWGKSERFQTVLRCFGKSPPRELKWWRGVQGKSEKRKVCGPAGKWGVAGAGWLVCWGCRETVGKTELCAPAEGVADKTGANGG